jgi:hypothetical protein
VPEVNINSASSPASGWADVGAEIRIDRRFFGTRPANLTNRFMMADFLVVISPYFLSHPPARLNALVRQMQVFFQSGFERPVEELGLG